MSVRTQESVIVLSDEDDQESLGAIENAPFEAEGASRTLDRPNRDRYSRSGPSLSTLPRRGGRLQGLNMATNSGENSHKRPASAVSEPVAKRPHGSFFEAFASTDILDDSEKNVGNDVSEPELSSVQTPGEVEVADATRRAPEIGEPEPRQNPEPEPEPLMSTDPEPVVSKPRATSSEIVVIDSDDDSENLESSTALDASSENETFHDAPTAIQPQRQTQQPRQNSLNQQMGEALTSHLERRDSDSFVDDTRDDSANTTSNISNYVDESSDDEIAILSKEEAERVGTFKKTSFVSSSPVSQSTSGRKPVPGQSSFSSVPRENIQPAQSSYNQPVPVQHAGAPSHTTPITTRADIAVRNYFMRVAMPSLESFERSLEAQIGALQGQINAFYAEVQEARTKMSMLTFDQTAVKDQLGSLVSDRLRLADKSLEEMKKTRRYHYILQTVKSWKQAPTQTTAPAPANTQPESMYGNNVNPYMNRAPNADHQDLETLFRDLYREEKIEGMAPTPEALTIQLLDHQRRGLFWLLKKEKARSGCILADDMGLGKTVQTLAVMTANMPLNPSCKTTLIVGPVSLLRQWDAEIKAKIKPSHSLKVAFYHGSDKRRLGTFRHMGAYDVVLTSYTTLASEFKQHFGLEMENAQVTNNSNALPSRGTGGQRYMSPFYSPDANFFRIVLDEAQYIRNKLSQASKSTACLRGEHRLCLTGTPMQNNIEELYPILRFLGSRPYDDEKKFKMDISVPLKSTSENFDDYDRNQSMQKLRAVLSAVMLRRTKDSKVDGKPLIVLPEKTVDSVFVTMESEEREYYIALEKGIQKKARKLMASANSSGSNSFLTLLLRLRQACIHQLLVQVGELNSQENSDSFQGNNWMKMYQRVLNMNPAVRSTVQALVGHDTVDAFIDSGELPSGAVKEVQLTCPVCFDVVEQDSIIILANCGHMVCDGCVGNLFSGDSDGLAQQTADCSTCKIVTASSDLVDYGLYTKVVHESYDSAKLERLYGMSNTKKTSNTEKVKFLIRRDEGFTPSAKMERTLDLIKEITENTTDEKIIVFSHFTVTFDLIGFALRQEDIEFLRYDGSMNIDEKNKTISEFYQGSSRVLLISLKAGNVGLTLTCASHVVIMDPFWNPYVEDQAMDRAHRFGQERPVKVYRLLIKDSVEDRIIDLQQRKKELIGSALDENALKSSSSLGRRELGYLFGLNSLR